MDLASFVALAEKAGLGIVMSGTVACMFFYVIKQLIAGHKADRALYAETLKAKDTTINNHIAHFTDSNTQLKETVIKLDIKNDIQTQAIETMGEKIVTAIHDQSELMKEIARKDK